MLEKDNSVIGRNLKERTLADFENLTSGLSHAVPNYSMLMRHLLQNQNQPPN